MATFFGSDSPIPSTTTRKADEKSFDFRALTLDLSDEAFVKALDSRIEQSQSWFEKERNLKERRQLNKDYRFGRQLNKLQLKDYQARYQDNVIYEGEGTIKPIAMSRLPEMTVKPGKDDEESKETAENLSKILNTDLRSRENRRVLGLAFQHQALLFLFQL